MAGIGFELRKITRKHDLLSLAKGYLHATLISSGPWLLTIFCLGGINIYSQSLLSHELISQFRIIVIYNFCFSLVLSGPILMVATRFLADQIYAKNAEAASALMIGVLLLIIGTQFPVACGFYFFVAEIDDLTRIAAIINYILIACMWLVMVFLTAIKAFNLVTIVFFMGLSIAFVMTMWAVNFQNTAVMLTGFSVGLLFVVFIMLGNIFAEYPITRSNPFAFLKSFKRYWQLAFIGLTYNTAIWVDKWVMWFAPEHEELIAGMPSYPGYDSAMFLAYLTIIPSLTIFMVSMETRFFEKYLRFYREIRTHGNLDNIKDNHQAMVTTLAEESRNIFVIQMAVSITAIILASHILELFNSSFNQISIFRFGVLGSMFHIFWAQLLIIIFYFDFRKVALGLTTLFLILNFTMSLITLKLGFGYYGFGYFLAALTSFSIAAIVTVECVYIVPYHTFVLNNKSI